jgi:hypothetical protein
LDNDINFTQPVKEKRNIIMTKICKRCSKKEAEYCETCMNEENEQYMRLSDLRNNTIVIDRGESVEEPNIEEPIPVPVVKLIIEEPIPVPVVKPILEPIVEEPILEEPIIEPIVEPIPVLVEEPIVEEPILEPIVESVLEPNIIDGPIVEDSVDEPVIENNEMLIMEMPVIEMPLIEENRIETQAILEANETILEPINSTVSPSQLYNIYESNINDNTLYINTDIMIQLTSENELSQPSEPTDISQPIDITIDNITNTSAIERKLHNNPPFFLDMNIPKNELNHPINELNHTNKTPKKKKKHKK